MNFALKNVAAQADSLQVVRRKRLRIGTLESFFVHS
jgi:hypothetical protein